MSEPAQQTILVIDVEAQTRDLLAVALCENSYRAVTASGVVEAFAYIDANLPPDLIVLQVPLAEMDTVSFLWRLRSAIPEPFPPVVAVTRATVIGDAWARAYGFAGLIRKPIDTQEAVALVGRCLQENPPSAENPG